MTVSLRQYRDHRRTWRENYYVYPVVSRRSRGLSIGINLNPDTACNFDCIYCQVDRTGRPRVRTVDLAILRTELREMLALALNGKLAEEEQFADAPAGALQLRDIAFSGDGEPTTCPQFADAVALVAELHSEFSLVDMETVLITDCCYLDRPAVANAVTAMDECNGVIWAKLDAGTEEYYRLVNRPNFPLSHVLANITAHARRRRLDIQSLFMRVHGEGPSGNEIDAYIGRLRDIVSQGGKIREVQIYTVARRPAQPYVAALSNHQVDAIAAAVRTQTGLHACPYYGVD